VPIRLDIRGVAQGLAHHRQVPHASACVDWEATEMVKRFAMVVGLLLVLGLPVLASGAGHAAAAPIEPKDAVAFCRLLDERGILDRPELGLTRGECVNEVKGSASEDANNLSAGLCGEGFVLQLTGTTNKGQCIQFFRTAFA